MTQKELRSILKYLSEYQINQLGQVAQQFVTLNQELENIKPEVCPVCGELKARFIRKGLQRGKQRFQCKSCGHKFTYDTKQLTSHSQQPVEAWITVLEDTLSLEALDNTSKKIGVCHSTAFHMRHKLLVYLEEALNRSEPMEALIEVDETYLLESQKGTRVTHRKARRHGERSGIHGLSKDKLSVCMASDRTDHVFARCVNRAKPGSVDLVNALGSHIAEKSVLLCDGLSGVNLLAETTKCEKVVLTGRAAYNKVYHLNTINGLHSRFKEMIRRFRGVATKYLNRYAALFALIAMKAEYPITEATDQVRHSLRSILLPVTINSLNTRNILTI